MYKIHVEQFEGPLDLLLQLIEQNKLDITKLSLVQITEQYIKVLHNAKDTISAGELADFLVVAAKLLVIKSKALMPYLVDEEDEEEEDLERQLRMYREYYLATKDIAKIIAKKKFSFSRQRLFTIQDVGFAPPSNLHTHRLSQIFHEIINGLESPVVLAKGIVRKTVHISEKIQHMRELFVREFSVNFKKILESAKDKTEVIVSFLAVLELMKQKEIFAKQDSRFQDIIIEKNTTN